MTRHATRHALTLERGLCVLYVLAEHGEGLTVSELADELGTHRAGIYRLLGPHLDRRLVRRREDGRYQLGAGLIELASRVEPRLREVARPLLQQLADDLRATSALTVRDGEDAVVVMVCEPRSTDMHLTYRAGMRHPVSVGAPGIAILAADQPNPGERPEVADARTRGWSVSSGELLPGATGVAAPVVTHGAHAPAAVSAVWVGEREPVQMVAPVLATVAALVRAL